MAWNLISIVDPVFTLVLVAGLAWALAKRNAWPAWGALALALLYLSFGMFQRDRAEAAAHTLALICGHAVERLVVHPTLGNLLLWRSIYSAHGQYHVYAVRMGLLAPGRVYEGSSLPRFSPADLPGLKPGSGWRAT